MNYSKRPLKSNQGIRAQNVRLIDDEGVMIGVVSLREAQEMARQKEMDLIEISPDSDPPVCKIGDYGKMRYKEQKKKNEMRKKQKIVLIKEIQLRPQIQEHDYQFKLSHAIGFLKDRDKVKITLQFRGREITFAENGKKIMERMILDLKDYGKTESPARMEGKRMIVMISPLKEIPQETTKNTTAESSPVT